MPLGPPMILPAPAEEQPLSPAAWRLHCVTVASMLTMLATVVVLSLVGAA